MNLSEKLKEIQKRKIIQEYQNNSFCNITNICDRDNLKNYHQFVKRNIGYSSKYLCNDNFSFGKGITIAQRMEWIISKIQEISYDNDTIILPFLEFGIECKIIDIHSFFMNEIEKKKNNFEGLDIGYINKTRCKNHYFSDEENVIFEYLGNVPDLVMK